MVDNIRTLRQVENDAAFAEGYKAAEGLLDLYQKFTLSTWVRAVDEFTDLNHATHGLFAEAGEVAAAYQKFYRGDYDEEELIKRVKGEIGGLMYYTAMLCNLEGITLSSILVDNRDKLIDRQNRGKIQGDGDNR